MSSTQSTQLQCIAKGGPFKVVTVATPALQPHQVLVRQHVIALNGLDYKQRDHGFFVSEWPYVLGVEGAGVIEAVGSAVTGFAVGDEVAGRMATADSDTGSYQERVAVSTKNLVKKPANISLLEAASLPICYATAVVAIYGSLKIPLPFLPETFTTGTEPKSILILGGSSACGASAIQLLRLAYPSLPILATSSKPHHERLKSLGATYVFDYNTSDLVEQIVVASPGGKGVDIILDCVSSGAFQKNICDTFDNNGSHQYAHIITGTEVQVPSRVTKMDVSAYDLLGLQGGSLILPTLTSLVEEGKYKVPVPVKVIGKKLDDIPEVMDQLKTVSGAKLVVTLE